MAKLYIFWCDDPDCCRGDIREINLDCDCGHDSLITDYDYELSQEDLKIFYTSDHSSLESEQNNGLNMWEIFKDRYITVICDYCLKENHFIIGSDLYNDFLESVNLEEAANVSANT